MLEPATLPLFGSRLIEASAGTGKTWTIAALYVRLVLGHGGEHAPPCPLTPSDILVMTFTRAATLELSDRIRERLAQAARYFRGDGTDDAFLDRLLNDYPEGTAREQAAWRLETAAQVMDEAAIYTIDAWCQRVLGEFAALTASLGEQTLAPSTAELLATAALDYWRQHVYPLQGTALETVLQRWPTALEWQRHSGTAVALADSVPSHPVAALPDWHIDQSLPEWLDALLPAMQQQLRTLADGWRERAARLRGWLDAQTDKDGTHQPHWDGRKLKPSSYTPWLDAIGAWADDPQAPLSLTAAAIHRLSEAGLQEARKAKAPPLSLPPEVAQLQTLWQQQEQLPDVPQLLQQHAAWHTRARFQHLKQQQGVFDFADALRRVEQALTGVHGATLRQRLALRYPVALVDEFQDTSAQQYRVFRHIYQPEANRADIALLIIGDPKQSIYRFRGADIHSYLQVRRQTQDRHYALGVNHRSTQHLVAAVNHVFAGAESRDGPGAFRYRPREGNNPLPFQPVAARGRAEYWGNADGELPALHIEAAWEAMRQPDAGELFAQQCAQQVVQWLNDPATGFYAHGNGHFTRLRPADMAVLVRNRNEAALVQQALRQRGLASVYLSDRESVFGSGVAHDMVAWMQAVAQPLDIRLARAALASPMLALPLAELERLADDEAALEEHLLLLQDLHGIWARHGILPMLRQSLHRLNLPARWLADDAQGERKLTNFLHLAELLQQAARTIEGEQALTRWLVQQIQAALQGQTGDADEQIVRLESDADLIKIVTIHKSKGLEYPVVLLPFACHHSRVARGSHPGEKSEDDHAGDSMSAPDTDEERLREDLRLFYVALTRARHALWLGFASLQKGRSKDCQTHHSAWGYLLAGQPEQSLDAPAWQTLLHGWANGCAGIRVATLASSFETHHYVPREQPRPLAAERHYGGAPDRAWAISSFSALTRPGASADRLATPMLWQTLPQRADDEPRDPTSPAPATAPQPTDAAVWHRLPGGPRMGNFIHDQLEWLGYDGFPLQLADHERERITQNASHAGWEHHAPALITWLDTLLQTPLWAVVACEDGGTAPAAITLGTLPASLAELEFWMPARQLDANRLDALCQQWVWPDEPRPPLPQRQTHGMLMGFADLVFEHAGRYWVLDYKTNVLGADASAYHPDALRHTVLRHRYDLQAMLYLLALHRLLRARLGTAYSPEQHLGGALYWFVRGLDAPGHGLLQLPGQTQWLEHADAWLNTANVRHDTDAATSATTVLPTFQP